ncbi:MAG: exonuclease SbcCD subunit D [Mobilitalea sp.]
MKIFHISDLHIGKQLHYYNLCDNQLRILKQIVEKARQEQPSAIMIAGDIYDKSIPSAEAHMIFNQFLMDLSEIEPRIPILIIAGNHDSAERLNYASSFLEKHHIYISVLPPQKEDEFLKKIVLEDEHGEVNFYLLPFTKPGYVRHLFETGVISTYDTAISALIKRENIDFNQRNILISHQFYISGSTLPDTCESEQVYISVGGIDSVEVSHIKNFDYVALGHLHGQQHIGEKHIIYSGTPLKYSISEEKHEKCIVMVTIGKKNSEIMIDKLPLCPEQEVRKLKGTLREIIDSAEENNCHDYVSITLTDETELYRPKDQLEEHYDHILEVRIENSRTKAQLEPLTGEASALDPFEAFKEFYQEMQGVELNEEEEQIIADIIHQVKEADE